MKYYLGPYAWDLLPFPHWRPPNGTLGALDLRSLPAQAQQVIASGVGFFATDDATDLGLLYMPLGQGDLRSLNPTAKQRDDFASALGLVTLNGTSLAECLWDALTVQARPKGDTGPKPIMPTRRRVLELHLGGHSLVMSKPFNLAMPEAVNVKLVLQEDYRAIEAATKLGQTSDPELHQKVLGYWGRKYRVSDPENYFIPADMEKVEAIEPTTTITDNFNRADADPLGSSSEGWSWTEVEGDIDIVTNAAATGAESSHCNGRADSDLSSDDHYGQSVVTMASGGSRDARVFARYASAANTAYICLTDGPSTDTILYKVVTGNYTLLNDYNDNPGAPTARVHKLEVDGSSLTPTIGGTAKAPFTDTAITGNTRCGIGGFSNLTTHDDFEAADLSAGAATAALLLLQGNLRANMSRLRASFQ